MKTPYITIDLKKIQHNAKAISDLAGKYGVSIAGVTKGVLAMPEVTNAMIRGGVSWIADSRLDNIERHRANNINAPILLIRSPHKSEIERVLALADISLNSEYEIIRLLSEESVKKGMIHKIIIMVDTGDLREGVWPDELIPLVGEVIKMKGVKIIGLGTNLADLSGVIPTVENNQRLVSLAEETEDKFNIKLEYLSAGNSSSLKLLASGKLPARINHFRISEGIYLGREAIAREIMPGTYQDAFELLAEIIEKKDKPSVPIGEIGQNAFGQIPSFSDKGIRTRSILNIGRQDVSIEGLTPKDRGLEIIGACSDHLVMDTTSDESLKIGSVVAFDVNYAALLAAMTSPFVSKVLI